MIIKRLSALVLLLCVGVGLVGCSSMPNKTSGAMQGAALGGAASVLFGASDAQTIAAVIGGGILGYKAADPECSDTATRTRDYSGNRPTGWENTRQTQTCTTYGQRGAQSNYNF